MLSYLQRLRLRISVGPGDVDVWQRAEEFNSTTFGGLRPQIGVKAGDVDVWQRAEKLRERKFARLPSRAETTNGC